MPRQKLVGNLHRGGWLDGNVGQVVDKALFFGQTETCWSGDKQGRSKQDKKGNVGQLMVRRQKTGAFFGRKQQSFGIFQSRRLASVMNAFLFIECRIVFFVKSRIF